MLKLLLLLLLLLLLYRWFRSVSVVRRYTDRGQTSNPSSNSDFSKIIIIIIISYRTATAAAGHNNSNNNNNSDNIVFVRYSRVQTEHGTRNNDYYLKFWTEKIIERKTKIEHTSILPYTWRYNILFDYNL